MKIAVTGGLASGKTTVCRILEGYGAYVVDADLIVHRLLSSNKELQRQIVAWLGPEVVVGQQLDRTKIAAKVFSNPKKLQALEQLIHPAVSHEIETLYQTVHTQGAHTLFVAEVPLLFEAGQDPFYDAIIVVVAEAAVCRKRFVSSGAHSAHEFDQRMARQWPMDTKAARSQYVIQNNTTLVALQEQIKAMIAILLNKEQ